MSPSEPKPNSSGLASPMAEGSTGERGERQARVVPHASDYDRPGSARDLIPNTHSSWVPSLWDVDLPLKSLSFLQIARTSVNTPLFATVLLRKHTSKHLKSPGVSFGAETNHDRPWEASPK